MDKIPGRRFKFYRRVSSTIGTTAAESSLSTLPVNLQPNFLHPPDPHPNPAPPPGGTSVAARICTSLRQFRQRCVTRVPCIDRFLSPRRNAGGDGGENLHNIRYRRPKSQRQLARSRASISVTHGPEPNPGLSSVEEEGLRLKAISTLDPKRLDLRLEEKRLFSKLGPPRIRPRKMYTPDGKVMHYVIPCHSDSSLSDHQKNHKMIQVNSESLMKLVVVQQDENKGQSTGDNNNNSNGTPERPVGLPNAIDSSDEIVRSSPPSPRVKRVTFWDDLDEFNGNVIKTRTGERLKVPQETTAMNVSIPVDLDFLFKDTYSPEDEEEFQSNFEQRFQIPKDPVPSRPRSRSKSATCTPPEVSPVRPATQPVSRAASRSRKSPSTGAAVSVALTSRSKEQQTQADTPPSERGRVKYVPGRWSGRELWEQRVRLRTKRPVTPTPEPISKKDMTRDLTLKYGRFPKVLQMKKDKLEELRPSTAGGNLTRKRISFGRISNSVSSTSFTSHQRRQPQGAGTNKRNRLPSVSPSGGQGQRQELFPEFKLKRVQTPVRNLNQTSPAVGNERDDFRSPGRERLKRFLAPPEGGSISKDVSSIKTTKRLGSAIGADNWSLANQLLYGYLIGSEQAVRPSTAS